MRKIKKTWHSHRNLKYHFVKTIEDGEETVVIYKGYSKKRGWQYVAEAYWSFEILNDRAFEE